jgi:ribosomal protein S12 methylthiotransferase accessory factor YcaO
MQGLLAKLETAVRTGVISRPHVVFDADAFPFAAAVCAVRPTPGCRPPGNLFSKRIASGRGETAEEASTVAMIEAAERYSLQYSSLRDNWLYPFFTLGGSPEPAPQSGLALGAPDATCIVTSRGSAAGTTRDDASRRAVLELLEGEHHLDSQRDKRLSYYRPDGPGPLRGEFDWLHSQLRRLDCVILEGQGYFACYCSCADFDGGRPTMGGAAGLDLSETARAAARESIFHWRNMILLEQNAIDLQTLPEAEAHAVRRYRGAEPRPERLELPIRPWPRTPALSVDTEALCSTLHEVTGRRVRLFDMTDVELGVPVVRAYLG